MITRTVGNGRRIHTNGDFSGDVHIICTPDEVEPGDVPNPDGSTYVTVTIPFEDLKDLVAEYVRRRAISAIEEQSSDDILLSQFGVDLDEDRCD